MNIKWKDVCLTETATVKDSMQLLSDFGTRIVMIVDSNMLLLGTITDGDIRRGILRGLTFDAPVSEIMHKTPSVITEDMSSVQIRALFKEKNIIAAPIINADNQVIGLEDIASSQENERDDISVLIMAGGFGKRLGDLTKDVPKPMLPLGNKPILEHIIDSFVKQRFSNFFISTHYKSQAIKEYFGDGSEKGIAIQYLEEDHPLGTAGCLYFLKNKVKDLFIVINGDLQVDFDFDFLIDFHRKNKSLATMCVRQSKLHVPYGVVETDRMEVKKIIEKPLYTHNVNAGIYCFSKEVLSFITELEHIDMPELLQRIIDQNHKVLAFPLHEYWVDMGTFDTLNKARAEHIK